MKENDKKSILKAGEISKQVREYIPSIVKKGSKLVHIAEAIEKKITDLGGTLAFPVNISINETAAHHTPSHNDESVAHGLIKIDFGVSIEGWTADGALALDLENSSENAKLIHAAEDALAQALSKVSSTITLNNLGEIIQKTVEKHSFQPIVNLSGHSIDKYDLHAGITIPNFPNSDFKVLGEGLFAIEPFVTNGNGKVHDAKKSEIYKFVERKPVRDPHARKVLDFIEKTYKTLPFCSRWLVKHFGSRALISLHQLEQASALHQYDELVEISHKPVAQAEKTILVEKDNVIVVN